MIGVTGASMNGVVTDLQGNVIGLSSSGTALATTSANLRFNDQHAPDGLLARIRATAGQVTRDAAWSPEELIAAKGELFKGISSGVPDFSFL